MFASHKGQTANFWRSYRLLLVGVLVVLTTGTARGFEMDSQSVEEALAWSDFELQDLSDVRFDGDRNKHAWFVTPSGQRIEVKVQRINSMREEYNENPRYDIVSYEVQKLFLEPEDYVVPPAVLRSQPVDITRTWDAEAVEVAKGTGASVFLLQAWLPESNPLDKEVDFERIATDPGYARAWANFNVLTYMIRHNDSNKGNALIIEDDENPRIFAVDNNVAYLSDESNQGNVWRKLWTDRLPREMIDRLLALDKATITAALETVAEFQLVDGIYQPVAPGDVMSRRHGVRRKGDRMQLGLTAREIWEMERRLKKLQRDIMDKKITELP